MKEDGSSGEFEPIYETLVESQNELVDVGSISGFDGVGVFSTQSVIDNNWTTSSNLASSSNADRSTAHSSAKISFTRLTTSVIGVRPLRATPID